MLRAGDSGTHNNRKSQVESLEDGGKYTKIIIDGAINDGALAGAGAVVGKLGAQNGISPSSNNAFKAAQAGRKHAAFSKITQENLRVSSRAESLLCKNRLESTLIRLPIRKNISQISNSLTQGSKQHCSGTSGLPTLHVCKSRLIYFKDYSNY